jgi:hypothetical protein
MQSVKKLAVSRMASTGDDWNKALDKATDQYNKRPNPTVFGAPADVAKHKIAQFFIADEQAKNFIHNEKDTDRKAKDLERDGAFREAVSTGGRSFKPQYSGEVHPVTGLSQGRQYVESNGKQVLLKLAKPVPSTSEAPKKVLQSAPREEPERRRAPQPNPDNPMPKIPIKQGVPLMEGRPRTAASSSSSAPSSGAASSAASSSVPAFTNPRSAELAARFGGAEPKRTPEQHAQIKAEAQRKRDEKAAAARQRDAARQQKERQKEREAEERKSMAKAEKEARAAAKAQPKRR